MQAITLRQRHDPEQVHCTRCASRACQRVIGRQDRHEVHGPQRLDTPVANDRVQHRDDPLLAVDGRV